MHDDPITAFLKEAGWMRAERRGLAGDASSRSYERLTDPSGATAVLMRTPEEARRSQPAFVRVADHLKGLGLSPPAILAHDPAHGLVLLEDLGDALFTRIIAKTPEGERPLYLAATDVLVALKNAEPPEDGSKYTPYDMAAMTEPAFTWYARIEMSQAGGFLQGLAQALAALDWPDARLALRDFHADNLIWLPDRDGVQRVGLLDFQDAVICPAGYDLVSLLEDARRDVSPEVRAACIARYTDKTGADQAKLDAALATLGLQRNLRILGVFARLSLHYGKAHYIDFIPRVWAHLQGNLSHPDFAELKPKLAELIPDPTPERLQSLKDRCGTVQTP